MSQIRRSIASRQLKKFLSETDNEELFIHVWALDAVQSGRASVGRSLLICPDQAETRSLSSNFFVHKWEIETLLNEALATDKVKNPYGLSTYRLNLRTFEATVTLINALKKLENVDDGIAGKRTNIIELLPRLAHRQFEWQRGFFSKEQIYRSMFIYGDRLSGEYFQQAYGLSLKDFFYCGFALLAILKEHPGFVPTLDLADIGVSEEMKNAVFARLSTSHHEIARAAKKMRAIDFHVAYKKSVLRQTPLVRFDESSGAIRCPLVSLLEWRITSGLYYDLVGGGSAIWNEIGDRFHLYAHKFLKEMLRDVSVDADYEYRKGRYQTPDILVSRNRKIVVAIECKAKKMTFEARFSEAPIADARIGYDEIAKGVFQIWRFFFHCRTGVIQQSVDDLSVGVVLTLDPWLEVANSSRNEVLKKAKEIAAKREPDMVLDDFRPIVFCSIDDFEYTIGRINCTASVLDVLRKASEDRFAGYHLASILRDFFPSAKSKRRYPFRQDVSALMKDLGLSPFSRRK
ncbi:MAG: hypothetical protein E6Q28_16560 [Afipia sp.]|nr:MAG: hypothetical protein E6Q28_16560 [Afipia sp.]